MSEAPEWLVELVQDTRRLLGVGGDWHVNLRVVDSPHDDPTNSAAVTPDGVYLIATIEVARDVENSDEGRRIVMHEVMHIAHTELDLIVSQILAGLPKRERRRFRKLYEDGVERFLQRTTRAMVRHIRPMEEGSDD